MDFVLIKLKYLGEQIQNVAAMIELCSLDGLHKLRAGYEIKHLRKAVCYLSFCSEYHLGLVSS